jgi:hypothetical protein
LSHKEIKSDRPAEAYHDSANSSQSKSWYKDLILKQNNAFLPSHDLNAYGGKLGIEQIRSILGPAAGKKLSKDNVKSIVLDESCNGWYRLIRVGHGDYHIKKSQGKINHLDDLRKEYNSKYRGILVTKDGRVFTGNRPHRKSQD